MVAACWVASRSFKVDSLYGDMVPLADIFNHKAAVVCVADGYTVAGDSDSDTDIDTVGDSCEPSIGMPRSPRTTATEQHDSDYRWQDVDLRLEIAICNTGNNGDTDALEIVAACDLTSGQEIHNTYGEHSNSELVARYGFALPRQAVY
jgi:N-lysine methyltransferase SETD6